MTQRRAATACLLFLTYTGLTLLFTHPLVWHLGTHHVGAAAGDAKVYLWNYWWVHQALFELGVDPFQTDRIFHPIGIGLSLHTLSISQGIVAAPLRALMGEVVAANLVVMWTFVASALATYALARRLGATPSGGFLAGLVFAFCPYRLARLSGHYDLLGTEWIPLYALLLVEIHRRELFPVALAIAAGAVAALCGYTTLTYLAFIALFTVIFGVVHRENSRALLPRFALVAGAALFFLSPLIINMARDLSEWNYPRYPGADRYVADLLGYLVPPAQQTLIPGLALGANTTEATVFPGLTLLVLAAFGRRRRLWLWTALVFFILSLGSSLHFGGSDTGIPLPFRLVSAVPLLDNLRAPSRFAIMVLFSLSMMLALSWAPRRRLWTGLVTALVVIEYLAIPAPLFSAAVDDIYRKIGDDAGATTVVEIPGIEQSGADVMHHQRAHEKPVFVGFAARVPTEKSEYWLGLPFVRPLIDLRKGRVELSPELIARQRQAAPAVARFLDIGYLVIDKAFDKRGVVTFVSEVLPVDIFHEDEHRIVLRTRTDALPPNPTSLGAGDPSSRQHYESGWMRVENDDNGAFRWAHRARSTVLFRRPEGARQLVVELSPLEGFDQLVRAEIAGKEVDRMRLAPGWQELRLALPDASGVERLTLRWSQLRQASETDPRRLAARIRRVRFE